ncbi:hypothetical protein [Nocardia sp. NPDC052566]|uniref:hypothetical protein n=1 Tax=Nocardia sp. NPDC052566 TaxID=3364330 RepID=UPI0037C8E57C
MTADGEDEIRGRVPVTLRVAGGLVAFEGAALVTLAAIQVGITSRIGFEVAWAALFGLAVFVAGAGLFAGQHWGLWRGVAIVVQLPLLLTAASGLFTDDTDWRQVAVVGGVSGAVVALLCTRSARRWLGPFRF